MKFKIVLIMLNMLALITLSEVKAYDYFGIYNGPEKPSILFFSVISKDSVNNTCFLTSPDLEFKNIKANNFTVTKQDFYFYAYSDKYEIDLSSKRFSDYYDGAGVIDGFVGKFKVYPFDKETLIVLDKYTGIYYSIDKKDSIVVNIHDSLSLIISLQNSINKKKELTVIYPTSTDTFISHDGYNYEFKLRNFIPWQIMYIYEGHEYFFYKEL